MYNRYIRNDDGVYARQPQPEPDPPRQEAPPPPPRSDPPHRHEPPPPPKGGIQLPFLSGILEKLHLGSIDFGNISKPKCDTCPIRRLCLRGCYGAQYESN